MIPELRLQACNTAPPRPQSDYVLYWMIAARRTQWNFALDRAVELARQYRRPLVILEPLECSYQWACDRIHRFVMEGMEENDRRLESKPVLYYPYVEPLRGAGHGLLAALAARACAVVTDDFPCFMLPRRVSGAAKGLAVRMEQVDGNGLLPLRATERVFPTAHAFRRYLQRSLGSFLPERPKADPLGRLSLPRLKELPRAISARWPRARFPLDPSGFPIDHSVPPVPTPGGARAAGKALERFLEDRLDRYGEERNQPEKEGTSGLSPYLHFGHLSAHEVVHRLLRRAGWTPARLSKSVDGSRRGWWGVDPSSEAFLDQAVTWRELGFNLSSKRPDYDQFSSLPTWARSTLQKHAADPRPVVYGLPELETASTHDPLWNAAQNQLRREGRIHNTLRMLWGKKILEWSESPERALEILIELNNKYALDGRDPNSYSGIFWTLGRYDRPWGPERPIFGTVRYMSSSNTARKVRVREYLARYSEAAGVRPGAPPVPPRSPHGGG